MPNNRSVSSDGEKMFGQSPNWRLQLWSVRAIMAPRYDMAEAYDAIGTNHLVKRGAGSG